MDARVKSGHDGFNFDIRKGGALGVSILVVVVVVLGFVGMLGVPGSESALLDAFDTVAKDTGNNLLGFVVARAVGVEIRLPVDHRAVWLFVHLQPELGRVV